MLPLIALVFPAVHETAAFFPTGSLSRASVAPAQWRQQRRGGAGGRPVGPLGVAIDPHEAIQHVTAAVDFVQQHGGGGAGHVADPSQAEAAFTSLSTASADAAVLGNKYSWEFFGLHGQKVNPLGEFVSVPPGKGLPNAGLTKDYFFPEDPRAAAEALRSQSKAAGDVVGIDSSQIRDALPGGRPEVFFDTPINPNVPQQSLTAEDFDEILHDGDILSRLPMVAFSMVLVDFFFFNSGNDVYRDEIDNDEPALRARWVAQVVPRLGIGMVLALLTIASSYMFYHPIP